MSLILRTFVLVVTASGLVSLQPASPSMAHPDVKGDSLVCHEHWNKGKGEVKRQIKCLARRWDVSVEKAMAVADCESDFRPRLRWRGYLGTYQHSGALWRDRVRTYLRRHPNASALNNRWNTMVTMKMVHYRGWGPWSCA